MRWQKVLVALYCGYLFLGSPSFLRADTIEDQFKSYLSQHLANQDYAFHKDDTHHVFGGKKGKEWFVKNGKTGIPEIHITKMGDGFDVKLIADVTLPYSGDYLEKNFIGVGGEHQDDHKNPKGKLKFRFTKTFLNAVVENVQAIDTK